MTHMSVRPVGQVVRELSTSPVVRVARSDRSIPSSTHPTPARPSWPVSSAAAALAASVALLALVPFTSLDPRVAAGLVVVWPLLLAAQGCFVARPLGDSVSARAVRVARAGATLGLLSWLLALVAGAHASPQAMVPATASVTASGLLVLAVAPRRRQTRVVLAGAAADVAWAAAELRTRPDLDVVGACVPTETAGPSVDYPVREGVANAVTHAVVHDADLMVLLPGSDLSPQQVRRLQWEAATQHVGVYLGTGLLDVAPFRMSLTAGGGLGLVQVRPSAHAGWRRLAKEVVERSAAAVGLLLLTPVLLAVAVLVRLDSAGSPLFRQQRVGQHGELFTMYKFRTMSTGAEAERALLAELNEHDGVLFKMRSDPRITRVGRVLRRYSLDELPQLWNVLVGDMALVGPRPALPAEVAQYDHDPRRRLLVKPGLTGLWQVSGRSDLDWEQTVRLDLRYVDNWSLRLDAAILVRTARAVLDHRGAY